jgi:hypothetical protein
MEVDMKRYLLPGLMLTAAIAATPAAAGARTPQCEAIVATIGYYQQLVAGTTNQALKNQYLEKIEQIRTEANANGACDV